MQPTNSAPAQSEIDLNDGNLPSGLTSAQAQARLAADGSNELPGNGPRGWLAIAREVVFEPMFLLLLAAAGTYLVLGEAREAIALSASILVVIVITILQERRTETALSKLRDLSGTRALVIRDGVRLSIPGRELVVGDVILLNEGDRIPADAELLNATALSVDESILTGESLPVDKFAATTTTTDSNKDQRVYSGTLALRGHGVARITATGARSEMGKIGRALVDLRPEVTPLFHEVRHIVRWVAGISVLVCVVIAIIYGLTRQDWLGGALAGITVAMSLLPEEFPVVLTVFLAMGAWRISRQHVLTRRMPAIESIGAATLLAVDKTGTLTENRMRVAVVDSLTTKADLRAANPQFDDKTRQVLTTANAASEREAFDPMEHAIRDAAQQWLDKDSSDATNQQLVREYDLTPELLAVTHVWQRSAATFDIAVKGAPETVFDLCRIDAEQHRELMQRVTAYADQGLRVLAVARGEQHGDVLPASPRGFQLKLLGLLCLADPLRENIPAALAECRQAGIRVVMITGDHAGTALAIAAQAGMDVSAGALTGAEVAALSPQALTDRTRHINVYARMAPEQKLSLVQAFKANGEIVVMTGDGVNDAPALKAAHVGVAMGGRGTEVARAAASLVLVNDDFGSLVGAVRLGRRIYDNIRHAMSYVIAVHVLIGGMGLLPVLFGWPLLLFPLHVMFLEFVIDPTCSLVFESDTDAGNIMRRPPRSVNARLFARPVLMQSVLRGAVVLAFNVGVYVLALRALPEDQARALSFMALVIGSVLLIFVSRLQPDLLAKEVHTASARPSALFWWVTGLTLVALAATLFVPAVAALFHFQTPPLQMVMLVPLAGFFMGSLVWWGRRWLPAFT